MPKNPVQFMTQHEKTVLEAYRSAGGPKKAWELLQTDLPDLGSAMKYNTFKQYITPFSIIMQQVAQQLHSLRNGSDKAAQECERVTQQLHKTVQEYERVAQQLHKTGNTCAELEAALSQAEKKTAELIQKNTGLIQENADLRHRTEEVRSELHKVAQEREAERVAQVTQVTQQLHRQSEPDAVTQKLHKTTVSIEGWSLQRAKDGYWRLHRKIRGRVHSIYLGKTPDPDEARRKIAAKEKALGLA